MRSRHTSLAETQHDVVLGIPPFFVAFILAPIASNASELIASISYASRKEEVGTEVAFGQVHDMCAVVAANT